MAKRKNTVLFVLLLLLSVTAWLVCRHVTPSVQMGQKNIALTVVHGDGRHSNYDIVTEKTTLADALLQANAVTEITDGFVSTVDGETADATREEWWRLTRDGEMLSRGVNDTRIADGEHYEFTLTVGYEG